MGVFIAEVVREGVGLSTGDALLYTPQESGKFGFPLIGYCYPRVT